MRILVTGAHGQLGRSLRNVLQGDASLEVDYTDADTLDITSVDALEEKICSADYDFLVNCAAYTAVDRAETEAAQASKLNTEAVGNMAAVADGHGVKVIHISTDYVFAGNNFRPYTENDEPAPSSVYGQTKLDGEALLMSVCPDSIILRTAWLYSEYGNNFVKTMLKKGDEGVSLKVVSDQIGTPTYSGDLAQAIHSIIKHPEWHPGIYHYSNEGVASWYDFAKSIFRSSGRDTIVSPCLTSEYPSKAVRPFYSVLDKTKIKNAFGLTIPHWQDSLLKCLSRINKY